MDGDGLWLVVVGGDAWLMAVLGSYMCSESIEAVALRETLPEMPRAGWPVAAWPHWV